MKKIELKNKKGFSLVEAILSIALLSILVVVFSDSLIYGQENERLSGERARAVFLAEEGLEAARNIRDENFSNLLPGTYGLSLSGNQWIFLGTNDAVGIFTRSIEISDIDANTKAVSSSVFWKQNEQRDGNITLNTRLTNWKKIRMTEAERLYIDISASDIDPGNNNRVIGVTLENIGSSGDITIDQMQISWTSNRRLREISIDETIVWAGNSGSGSVLNITDVILEQGVGSYNIDYLEFNNNFSGQTITIIFIMSDGSSKQVVFTPGDPPDETPPADIINLSASNPTLNSIDLSWTAPGDDGNIGTASSYDIRYSTVNINDSNWGSAIQVAGAPLPLISGTVQSMTISGLLSSTTYYFAMKTSDEVPNTSGISNVASATTLSPPQANYLLINTTNARINPANNNQIIGITLQNSGPSDITIVSVTTSWSGVPANRRLRTISMGGLVVWTGNDKSGLTQDISDVMLVSGNPEIPLDFLQYNTNVSGITLNITFNMLDGSSKTVSGIIP